MQSLPLLGTIPGQSSLYAEPIIVDQEGLRE